ncbi:MAG: iron chelate uptake ABC transporter family permease subunit [Ignavibacteria bacterium]|nr:iron chelate uptake ABC transporter family permease subunit [Ignavibacteria bacterium]
MLCRCAFHCYRSDHFGDIVKGPEHYEFRRRDVVIIGTRCKKFQRLAILASSLLAAGAVSVAGIVSFAGLIVPNLSRLLIGNDYRYSVPCSVLMGSIFMLISDTIARTIISPSEIPLGIVTSFIGAPVFIWLMMKEIQIL